MVTSNGGEFEDESATEVEYVEVEEEPGLFDVPRKWSWFDLAYIGTTAGFGFFSVLTAFSGNVAAQIRAHEAYRRNAVDFASDVLSDIRKL